MQRKHISAPDVVFDVVSVVLSYFEIFRRTMKIIVALKSTNPRFTGNHRTQN